MEFLVVVDDKTFRDATSLLIDSEGHYAEAAGKACVLLTKRLESTPYSVVTNACTESPPTWQGLFNGDILF